MSIDVDGNEMLVKFKDYGFFVPKNSANHEAIISGWAYSDSLSVTEQIELAKDASATDGEKCNLHSASLLHGLCAQYFHRYHIPSQ
jgi:hypothetical protein